MKAKKQQPSEPMELHDRAEVYTADPVMVRTQVYLTKAEHGFLTREGERTGKGLSGVLRAIVDEKMSIPEDAWTNNPMLEPTVEDSECDLPEDASLNHDYYAYGAPKKYKKVRGHWVMKAEDES
jgi:hypothetical protein